MHVRETRRAARCSLTRQPSQTAALPRTVTRPASRQEGHRCLQRPRHSAKTQRGSEGGSACVQGHDLSPSRPCRGRQPALGFSPLILWAGSRASGEGVSSSWTSVVPGSGASGPLLLRPGRVTWPTSPPKDVTSSSSLTDEDDQLWGALKDLPGARAGAASNL